jgi:protein arginine kinase activator
MHHGQQCQRCKKAVATVHLTDVNKNGNRERHLCERCAAEEGYAVKTPHMQVNELLTNFVLQQPQIQELAHLTCPRCHTTFIEFRNTGLLGCPHDYEVFENALLPLIQRAQDGNTRHVGKSPRRLGAPRNFQSELVRLRRNLAEAVEREDFESAARLRDQIESIELK